MHVVNFALCLQLLELFHERLDISIKRNKTLRAWHMAFSVPSGKMELNQTRVIAVKTRKLTHLNDTLKSKRNPYHTITNTSDHRAHNILAPPFMHRGTCFIMETVTRYGACLVGQFIEATPSPCNYAHSPRQEEGARIYMHDKHTHPYSCGPIQVEDYHLKPNSCCNWGWNRMTPSTQYARLPICSWLLGYGKDQLWVLILKFAL